MAKIDYLNLLKKSWDNFRANLVIVLPILISIALMIGFSLLLIIEFLIFYLVFSKEIINNPGMILSFTGIFLAVLFIILDFIVLILITSYSRSMQIGMLRDIMLYKRTNIKNMFVYGRLYLKRYFKLTLLTTLIYFLPLALSTGICALAFLSSKIIGIILIILSSFIMLAYFIFLTFFLFFMDPIFVTENKPAIEIIKSSFSYTKRNFTHVFFTWGVSFLTALVVSVALFIVTFPLGIISGISSLMASALAISIVMRILSQLISTVVNIVLGLVLGLFQFNSYFSKNRLYRLKKPLKLA